jgi:acrylyl-CoA reductase (NADPH)
MGRALFLRKTTGDVHAQIDELDRKALPVGDTLVAISHSGLNYKDALAITGRGKIIRGDYPFIPGIDFVGEVVDSKSTVFAQGDPVIGTGWGLGETHWGGYSQLQRVQGEWLVRLPQMLSPENAMVVGTAGLTAMLSMMALQDAGLNPSRGEVIVTGASGGVGSLAVALLSASGYPAVASTGSTSAHEYLRDLGAARIIDRGELAAGPGRPLDSARWAGGIDVVGGSTLAAIISQLDRHGSVAACGLAGGHEFCTTVYPFILRGVNLLGIDSNTCPIERRMEAWDQIAHLLSPDVLSRIKADTITLEEIRTYSERILAGGITGRVVVDVHR